MSENEMDELMLDGNAVAGMMQEIFGTEMTAQTGVCASCGTPSQMGAVLAFTQAPGVVLRCPACKEVMMRMVKTPKGVIFEARGTAQFWMAVRPDRLEASLE